MIEQILTHPGDVLHHGDVQRLEVRSRTETGQEHESGSVDGTGAEDRFSFCGQGQTGPRLKSQVDAGDLVTTTDIDPRDPSVGEDLEVGPILLASEDGVDVRHAGGRTSSVVRVVRDGEKPDTLLE